LAGKSKRPLARDDFSGELDENVFSDQTRKSTRDSLGQAIEECPYTTEQQRTNNVKDQKRALERRTFKARFNPEDAVASKPAAYDKDRRQGHASNP